MEIRQVRFTDPDAAALTEQVQAEYTILYGNPDETPLDPAMFDAPGGAFFVGYVDGVPSAMGGWRYRADVAALGGARAAEVKRMYVAPAGRRTGLARQVLSHLEATAAADGADVMVLETGLRQPEAIALYVSAGYQPVAAFGHYAWSPTARYLGKRLGPPSPRR